jgi:hypothetical protein
MIPKHTRARTLRLPLAAALLATSAPLLAQSITNPSFEANTFTNLPGDTASNTPITGWTATPAAQVGLNPAGGNIYANNGAVPNGSNVAFLRAGATGQSSLKTTATGLTIGTKYNVSFRVNARSQTALNSPRLVFSTNGTGETVKAEIARVSTAIDANPYRYAAFEFVATGTSQDLTITNERTTGDHTLLIDDFKIVVSSGAWSFRPWTGDADSGLDSQYVYTHSDNFGPVNNASVTINGVTLYGGDFTAERRLQATGLTGTTTFAAGAVQLTGSSAALASSLRYGGSPSLTLQNLKPNTQYKFSLYGAGWDAVGAEGVSPPRAATFSSNGTPDMLTVNLNQYGQNKGIVIDYTYTTDALGSDVTISYPGLGADPTGAVNSFHTSGFVNRETTPRVAPATWTSTAWTNDADSGVDGSYKYTHAYNLASTVAANVNGVVFTPLPPGTLKSAETVPLYSTTMNGQVTTDTNQLTALPGNGSSDLAHSFVFGGLLPEEHKLTGLTPGKQYVVSIYSVGWDATPRSGLFKADVGDGGTVLDQTLYGVDFGMRWDHPYTAGADGVLIVSVSPVDGVTANHHYAITNREAAQTVGVAPTITLTPVGATLAIGDTYTLRVGAIGSAGITYQWKKNGNVIPGATDPTYAINGAAASDVGAYTVVITNSSGTVTSTAVNLDVRTLALGNFNTGVDDTAAPLGGGVIDAHFTLTVNPDSAATTAFVETNLPGSWTTSSTTAKWVGPRADTSAAAGGNYVYRTQIDLTGFTLSSVQITGGWATDNGGTAIKVNDVAVPGMTNTAGVTFGALAPFTINLANTPGLIAGVNNIDFYVTNDTSGLTGLLVDNLKVVGTIPAGTAPHIVLQPRSQVAAHGASVQLTTAANGSATLSYQWYLNTVAIPGATDSIYAISVDSQAAAGSYTVKVTNSVTSVTSNPAVVTIATNNVPVAQDDSEVTTKDTPKDIGDLLDNDTDADAGDILNITGVSPFSSKLGTVVLSGGVVTYTPPAGFTGTDLFTYTIDDGWGGSATGNVFVTVSAAATGGGAPSTPVILTLSSGTLNGSFTGTANATYTVERSTDLVTWSPLPDVTADGAGAVQFSDPAPPAGKAFYRVSYNAP